MYVCVLKFIERFDCFFFWFVDFFRQQFSFHDNTLFVYTVLLVRFFFSFLFLIFFFGVEVNKNTLLFYFTVMIFFFFLAWHLLRFAQ